MAPLLSVRKGLWPFSIKLEMFVCDVDVGGVSVSVSVFYWCRMGFRFSLGTCA